MDKKKAIRYSRLTYHKTVVVSKGYSMILILFVIFYTLPDSSSWERMERKAPSLILTSAEDGNFFSPWPTLKVSTLMKLSISLGRQ